jgi:hypothetical protein
MIRCTSSILVFYKYRDWVRRFFQGLMQSHFSYRNLIRNYNLLVVYTYTNCPKVTLGNSKIDVEVECYRAVFPTRAEIELCSKHVPSTTSTHNVDLRIRPH